MGASAGRVAYHLVKGLLRRGLHERSCLNINVPAIPWSDLKGVRITRLGMRVYRDVIVEKTGGSYIHKDSVVSALRDAAGFR